MQVFTPSTLYTYSNDYVRVIIGTFEFIPQEPAAFFSSAPVVPNLYPLRLIS